MSSLIHVEHENQSCIFKKSKISIRNGYVFEIEFMLFCIQFQ